MAIKIKTLSLEVPENKNNKPFNLQASVEIDEEFLNDFINKAIDKAKEKYPNSNIVPSMVRVNFSKRESENYLTSSCEMCIGQGDYISRVVRRSLPEILID